MNDIKWISTQEHDGVAGFVSAINANRNLYNWGVESGSDMGRGAVNTTEYTVRNPGMPVNWEAGNSNSNLLFVENGGHTTMVLQECKNTFGYVGHYRYGSMGDGRAGGSNTGDHFIRFTTSPLLVCGIETTPVNFVVNSATSNNEYCNSLGTIQLAGSPAGGTYKILEVDAGTNFQGLKFTDAANNSTTGNLDLSAFAIPANGSRTVRLGYVIPEGQPCAGNEVQLLINIKACIVYNVAISGKIWVDADQDAIDDSSESPLANSGRYANLVDANGEVIQSVPVDPVTGEYTITAGQNTLASSGDYKIILTTNPRTPGTYLDAGASAPNGYKYTGTNRNNGVDPATSGNLSEQSGVLSLGDLSSYANGSAHVTLDDANFGVKGNIAISGKIWHDTNGNAETEGTEKPVSGDRTDNNGNNSSVTTSDIWANLVDENGEVVKSVKIANDGTYSFAGLTPGASYKVILTTGEQQEGDPLATGASITGWVGTGTNDPVNGKEATNKTNMIDLGQVSGNVTNVNFGLQQPPVAEGSEYLIAKPVSGATIPLNNTVVAINPSGSVEPPVGDDPDKTNDARPSVKITALPYVPTGQETNAAPKLFYNNVEITAADYVIQNFDPSLFSVKLDGIGYDEVSFDFTVIDAAGEESREATYTLKWEGALPVKWEAISVIEEQGIAIVSWRTTEQVNVASFEVQNSTDARNWRTVGTVEAINMSKAAYSYSHKLGGHHVEYFRIRSKDFDGSSSLSQIVSLKGKKQTGSVYPNPVVAGELTFDLPVSGLLKIKVYSTVGTEVLSTTLKSNVLNVRNLSSGHYVLQVTGQNGEVVTRNFIVK
ncbi:hypothetical protein GCM10023091_37030 [Ravibacter arvi]|uniref:Secretion system C-terminal sorting domain-containing protein n=2 Tax=Ravibacter arvi TaxID=2051041 RepID=A0ABP8MA22_9BACT